MVFGRTQGGGFASLFHLSTPSSTFAQGFGGQAAFGQGCDWLPAKAEGRSMNDVIAWGKSDKRKAESGKKRVATSFGGIN